MLVRPMKSEENMRKLSSVLALSSIVLIITAASAQAADVTLGPDLTGTYTSSSCDVACTLANVSLTQPGAQLTSPVSGAVVRWHVIGGSTAGTYRLRTMSQTAPSSFLFSGSSELVSSVPSAGIQTFTATMPIAAGQTIGLDMSETASIGLGSGLGTFEQWEPVPTDGTSPATINNGTVSIGFNAEVQPAPTVTSLGTTSGPTGGGTAVTITGTDLDGATAVKFGSSSAAAFTIDSEGQITATSPAGSGSVPVIVTTVAGTATSGQRFSYQAPQASNPNPNPTPTPAPISAPAKTCAVPKLKGKSLKAARTAIIRADCNVGRVNKKKGVKAATAKVVGQSSKPGTVLPARTAVNVTLGQGSSRH
jgi:hypothetical protein